MGGSSPHDIFKALGPAEWGKDLDADSQDSVRDFMMTTFTDAQTVIDSIPVATGAVATQAKTGRPRAATDTSTVSPPSLPGRAPQTSDGAKTLRKDWKEVKVNPSENALGINVYKMSGKDGKGAWFARRSLHEGLSFERWKLGMEREFAETMKVKKDPGSGNIRGIGAERCVENIIVDGCGKAKVYQLSAQFPGPTTPRDFVTLMLTSDSAIEAPQPAQDGQKQARYFMVVSKPCVHPDAAERNGFIRGYYESVEFIREIKVGKPLRRTQSSIDMSRSTANEPGSSKEAVNRSARQAALAASASDVGDAGRSRGKTIAFAGTDDGKDGQAGDDDDDQETVIEWLMVTRSDPGGSVPRFMVERGTPAGICGDASKFLKWVSSKSLEDFDEADELDSKFKGEAKSAEETAQMKQLSSTEPTSNILEKAPPLPKRPVSTTQQSHSRAAATGTIYGEEESPEPQGFYGVIANALGAMASHLPNPFSGSTKGEDTEPSSSGSSLSDDTSSINSFHSADEDEKHNGAGTSSSTTNLTRIPTGSEKLSIHSTESASLPAAVVSSNSSTTKDKNNNKNITQHEKDLMKLESRKRKMEEKHARDLAKRADDSTKDESAIAKLKEKHERDKARQEERYQRELRKLEQRRVNEERKQERRRQKAVEKQEKSDLAMEMERVKAQRDVALKQIEVLKEQVGDLQSQNTLLVARLGREGIEIDLSKGGKGIEGIFGDLGVDGRKSAGAGAGVRVGENGAGSMGEGVVQVEGPACLRDPVKSEA